MGFFAVIFSLIIVIIQSTSILVGREAHEWTFPLLKNTPNISYLKMINHLFSNTHNTSLHPLDSNAIYHKDFSNQFNFQHDIIANASAVNDTSDEPYFDITLYIFNATTSSRGQALCLQSAWKDHSKTSFPIYCLLNSHLRYEIQRVLAEFNPHLILFTLSVIHAIFCIARVKRTVWSTLANTNVKLGLEQPHTISLPISTGVLYVFLIILFIIEGTKKSELVEYPTIILSIILLLSAVWFVYQFATRQDDYVWYNVFHMQLVGVPIAVLAIAVVGSRFWTDIVTHLALLTIATNIFGMSIHCSDEISKKVCEIIYVFLPIFCVYLAHLQWGNYDNWKYVIGLMGCASLLPFIVYPFFIQSMKRESDEETKEKRMKYFGKFSVLASSAALLSLVVNLAMFYEA